MTSDPALLPPSAASLPGRAVVAGVPVDPLPMSAIVQTILGWTALAGTHLAVGVNAHVCNIAAADPRFRQQVGAAELTYADGQSIVWAARLFRRTIPERVATTDLVFPLMAACAERAIPVFFFGAAEGVAERAAERLRALHPGISIRTSHGFVPDDGMDAVVDAVREHRTGVLLVGMGDPLQQEWIARNRDRLQVPAILSCGGLFDWTSGDNRRAPRWMIAAGLEWAWRLVIEPRRLARRYLLGNPAFVGLVILQALSRAPR